MAVEVMKIAGQELIDRAEELIPNTECIKNIDIWVKIPSITDNPDVISEMEVTTNLYPKRKNITKILNMRDDG